VNSTLAKSLHARLLAFGLIVLLSYPLATAKGAASLSPVQVSTQGENTEITVSLTGSSSFGAQVQPSPARVEVDFDSAVIASAAESEQHVGLVKGFHVEPANGRGSHLVFDLVRPAVVVSVHALPPGAGKPWRGVILLSASDAIAMHAMAGVAYRSDAAGEVVRQVEPPGPHILMLPNNIPKSPSTAGISTPPPAEPAPPVIVPPRREAAASHPTVVRPELNLESIIRPKRTIVIDAGHGGIDPGAESVAGYHEKEITLATALVLRRVLEATGRYKVALTRDSDVYLKLHERVARARAMHGDLFISLHADSAGGDSDRTTRGASIYTLSQTASDAESERYAQRENRADAIAGVDLDDKGDDVAGILVDLTVRETVNDGNRLAAMLESAFGQGGVSLLPRAPHRAAGFAVLKSPDIPSVLIEMGYLSDISDARDLASPAYQNRIARAITDGVERYFSWLEVSRL
jgi:N-acetylmuramoyl-L-alanine amidase